MFLNLLSSFSIIISLAVSLEQMGSSIPGVKKSDDTEKCEPKETKNNNNDNKMNK